MKSKKLFNRISMIYGIVVTSLFSIAVLPKLTEQIVEKGISTFIKETWASSVTLSDDPTAFFIIYIIGYVILWKKPLAGATVIIADSVLYFIISKNVWSLILVLPVFLVGLLYILTWITGRKK